MKQRSNKRFRVVGVANMFDSKIFMVDRFAECMAYCKENKWQVYIGNQIFALCIKEEV